MPPERPALVDAVGMGATRQRRPSAAACPRHSRPADLRPRPARRPSASDGPALDGAVGRYTSERRNAHRTEFSDEREVLYPWHPWSGGVVRVHEMIGKPLGTVLRCSRDLSGDRWLEVPAWMFDRAVCRSMTIAVRPQVDLATLLSLQALLAPLRSGDFDGPRSAHAPVPGAAKKSCGRKNRGDADAMPAPPSREPSGSSSTIRPLRLSAGGRPAPVAHAARRDAADGDQPRGTAHPGAQPEGSSPDRHGRDR
jgi:hypothetical protein